MSLRESSIHRRLDAKMKVGGMEAPDLLGVLIFAAIMNLIFGRMGFAFVFVIIIPLLLLTALYFGKRGKPDDFMLHFARFYLTPGFYAAGEKAKQNEIQLFRKILK